ncbi:hypothetical protein HK405_005822 [Cladochytrium tenue]|nr:hypothetical protein HK405_005822 [Cladochytrium tenue]
MSGTPMAAPPDGIASTTATSSVAAATSGLAKRVVMLGLDMSGKTTILYKLKINEVIITVPTIGFNYESLRYNNTVFSIADVGGQETIRRRWVNCTHLQNKHALIFVVDPHDRSRAAEARDALWSVLSRIDALAAGSPRGVPLLVWCNKQDLAGGSSSMEMSDIADVLGLAGCADRPWIVLPASGVSGKGLRRGLDWLIENVDWR